jgi:hypothetical protein
VEEPSTASTAEVAKLCQCSCLRLSLWLDSRMNHELEHEALQQKNLDSRLRIQPQFLPHIQAAFRPHVGALHDE